MNDDGRDLPQIETPLARLLKAEIARAGPMPISQFMSRCLWDDAHGYYATRGPIGVGGDFITASEISQTFGELIGLWSAVVWQQAMGRPHALTLIEYGPGRGTLIADALRASRIVEGYHASLAVRLVELSGVLKAAQQDALNETGVPVSWTENIADAHAPAIFIANEFLDAWPVSQWLRGPLGWHERQIGLGIDGRFTFTAATEPTTAPDLDALHPDAASGAIAERHDLNRFAAALERIAARGPLAGLIIDYGYTLPATGDTFQAVRNHRYESPLTAPGEADLTAHIDFAALAMTLDAHGLDLDGPVTQAEFLGSLGILERASRLMAANPARAAEIETGVARLIAPNGMGTLFKVLGVRSRNLAALPGFTAAPV